MGCLTS
jgi:calcium-dependent protein kinase